MNEKVADRELRRGTLELVLLKLLSGRPMYGYELITTLEQRGGQTFQIKEGTLYPILYRLEKDGLVSANWETQERGVPRKYYQLTEMGHLELDSQIADWRAFYTTVNRMLEMEDIK